MTSLSNLSHLDLLRIICGDCGRTREIPSRFMAMMCGEEVHMTALRYSIICAAMSAGIVTIPNLKSLPVR